MNTFYPALLGLFPGGSQLRNRNYFSAALHAGAFALIVALRDGLPDLAWLAIVAGVVASSVYRMVHGEHVARHFREQAALLPSAAAAHAIAAALKPVWWVPVLNWPWLMLASMALVLRRLMQHTETSLQVLWDGIPAAMEMVRGFSEVNWALLPDAVHHAMQTLSIACLGTVVGASVALPISLICARNLTDRNGLSRLIYQVARWCMAIVRATPTFLLGLIFVACVGLGPFPGVLAISVFSAGLLAKLFSEAIEAVNPGPVEAVVSTGANAWQVVLFSVLPQLTTVLIAALLYCFEINIHSATVLGLIGAQGIGLPIHEYLGSLSYSNAAVYILVVIAITVATDGCSAWVRARVSK